MAAAPEIPLALDTPCLSILPTVPVPSVFKVTLLNVPELFPFLILPRLLVAEFALLVMVSFLNLSPEAVDPEVLEREAM